MKTFLLQKVFIQLTSAISTARYLERFSISPRFAIRVCIEKSSAISTARYLEHSLSRTLFNFPWRKSLLVISNFVKFSNEKEKRNMPRTYFEVQYQTMINACLLHRK